MTERQFIETRPDPQHSPGLLELKAILDNIDDRKLLDTLQAYRWTGRQGYSLSALWHAYIAIFALSLPHTNAVIRRLEDDAELRMLCGFNSPLPHRTTFNRFIKRLADHRDLVEECLAGLTDRLAETLPGFGQKVAIDSTVVRTHSNPNRKHVSDPEASWTKKHSADSKDGEDEWYFGYKYHAVVDAVYGLPVTGFTTTASRSDSPELPRLVRQAAKTYDWYAPTHVIADKGYDSMANHRFVLAHGSIPIIAIRDMPKGELREGIYTNDGTPTCMGLEPMEYITSDPEKGHLYRCRSEGCHLKDRKGVRYCHDSHWEDRKDNPRVFGPVRRGSDEWKSLYDLRQSVERVFKSSKQSRRLEDHCVRGLRDISLHAAMSMLVFQATALARIQAEQPEYMRWQVRRVA